MRRFLSLAAIAFLLATSAYAQDDGDKHCPNNPSGTTRFLAGSDMNREKSKMEALASVIAQKNLSACVLAFIDSDDPGYSKKLAIRRAVWARDILASKGVARTNISVELRLSTPDQNSDDIRQVHIITNR